MNLYVCLNAPPSPTVTGGALWCQGKQVRMPQWTRIFVLLTGIVAWLAMVGVSLWLQQIPSAVLIGFPAGLWIALRSTSNIGRERADTAQPTDDVAPADREEDAA